jgi:hypothetical protein
MCCTWCPTLKIDFQPVTDHGVHGGEVGADVFGGAARLGVQLEVVFFGRTVEFGLGVGGGEGFEEFLVGRGQAVVEFVAGGPEGVCDAISKVWRWFVETSK